MYYSYPLSSVVKVNFILSPLMYPQETWGHWYIGFAVLRNTPDQYIVLLCLVNVKLIKYDEHPLNIHAYRTLLWVVEVQFHPYPSMSIQRQWGSYTSTPIPVKPLWRIRVNAYWKPQGTDNKRTTNDTTTKPCAYLMRYIISVTINEGHSIVAQLIK